MGPARGVGPGARLGRFELLVPVGRGGMAEVWIARMLGDLGFSKLVALKTILPEFSSDPSFRRSLFEEARLAARLRHANVVEVTELAEDGPVLYQVMTWVEGDSLARLLSINPRGENGRKGLPPAAVARIMSDALAGLHAAHEVTDDDGVPIHLVHRDVSPQNILVGIDGVARLTDFGVAKALGRLSEETEAGQIRGKPGYFAPEQVKRLPLDRRCDIYAAGIVLWESLVGRRLFKGMDGGPAVAKLNQEILPSPLDFDPTIPPAIVEVTMRALTADREGRYATAALMRDALEAALASSGITATAKDVASVVQGLSGERIERQRAQLRERPAPKPASETPMSTAEIAMALRQTVGAPSAESSAAADLPEVSAELLLPTAEPTVVLPQRAREPAAGATAEMRAIEREALGENTKLRWWWALGLLAAGALAWVALRPAAAPTSTTPPPQEAPKPVEPPVAPSPSGAPAVASPAPPPPSTPIPSPPREVKHAPARRKPMFSNPYK